MRCNRNERARERERASEVVSEWERKRKNERAKARKRDGENEREWKRERGIKFFYERISNVRYIKQCREYDLRLRLSMCIVAPKTRARTWRHTCTERGDVISPSELGGRTPLNPFSTKRKEGIPRVFRDLLLSRHFSPTWDRSPLVFYVNESLN